MAKNFPKTEDLEVEEPDALELVDESPVETIKSEVEDSLSAAAAYEIVSIPSDFTLEGLLLKWNKKPRQLEIPGFQRKFVWSQRQASRLIESFLLGLPVPALFLYVDPDSGAQQVIDGQQRLMSVVQFFSGQFQNASMSKSRVFRLIGLSEDSKFTNMTCKQIEDQSPSTFAKLNDSVMRAFSIKQLNPSDSTSIYHIFERLNTGGTRLIGQEIRNCVYHGELNDLLNKLNQNSNWRAIIGKQQADSRMRDVEMILRFVGLFFDASDYKKPMKDFLSKEMRRHRNIGPKKGAKLERTFTRTAEVVVQKLGPTPFHRKNGMNPAFFDAVFTTIAKNLDKLPGDLSARYALLAKSKEFESSSEFRTTDVEEVRSRLRLAKEMLFE